MGSPQQKEQQPQPPVAGGGLPPSHRPLFAHVCNRVTERIKARREKQAAAARK
jgi:hypothetical protein